MKKDRIAIIAGDGVIPVILADRLSENGMLSLLIVLQGSAERFSRLPVTTHEIPPGRVKKLLDLIAKNRINKIIMIGKIDKAGFVERKGLDLRALQMIKKMRDGKDMSIFRVILEEFRNIGADVLPQNIFLKDMLLQKGAATKRKPSPKEISDASFGIAHAKKLASMDIGQTVIVKNQTIIAVEAVEGTNETIRRGALLSKEGFTVCKAARASQDSRFDIPGVGLDTLELMANCGGRMLALEAGKILLAEKEKTIEFANKNKISIIGM